MLLSVHNLAYYQDVMKGLRQAIREGTVPAFRERILAQSRLERTGKSDGDIAT